MQGRSGERKTLLMSNGAFAKELEVYRRYQAEWLSVHVGSFVAIQGEQVGGFFNSYMSF
jgi:hypothetical protein